jgi:hypothetical protein
MIDGRFRGTVIAERMIGARISAGLEVGPSETLTSNR